MSTVDEDRERTFASVFDALGHPTRLKVMKILQDQPLNFADLKRALNIESSGHLQYHLGKLGNLIKTDEHGKYALTDEGKDALWMVENVQKASSSENRTRLTPRMSAIFRIISTVAIVILAIVVIAAFLGNMYYEQTVYRYDIMVGDLYNPSASLKLHGSVGWTTIPFSLKPHQTLGFANVATPPSNFTNQWDERNEIDIQTHVWLPVQNQTFKRFSFAAFQLEINNTNPNTHNETADWMWFQINVPTGPNGSAWPEVTFYYSGDFPPYETRTAEPSTFATLPGTFEDWKFLPITEYGKYTYSLTNVGNKTLTGSTKLWSTEIAVTTQYLDTKLNSSISDPVKIYPETRTYMKPWTPDSIIFVASTVFFGALSIVLINKGSKFTVFRRS